MTTETVNWHRDLLDALADLPPSKVERFAIALGVPKNVVDESRINHPSDINRVKSDALSWWVANERVSWESVAKALEAKGVDERTLADSIRSSHGLIQTNDRKKLPLGVQDDAIVLNILLNCEQTRLSEIKQIRFKSLPTTLLEIKKKIEEDFSIPSCVQTLRYQSVILKDSDDLQHTYIRSGDTFSVDYPIEAECEMIRNVINWLKELFELLKSIEENISFPGKENDLLMASSSCIIENLILKGERDGITEAVSAALFPWGNKKQPNHFHFQHEGGLDVLMKVYSMLVSKEWGDLGIDKGYHIHLEETCSLAIYNYTQTIPLYCRQVVQLGGLEMCTMSLLRSQLQRGDGISDTLMYKALDSALSALYNLSTLPECRIPVAMRTDVIDQITLVIALHPDYNCGIAIVSLSIIELLAQSPETHAYIARKDVVENLLEVCKLKYKMINEPLSQSKQGQREDPMAVNALKLYTSIVFAQIGLGSPHLLFDSIPSHLQQQILNLMSDVLEAASLADICTYEEKEGLFWETFLPYLQYLYTPSNLATENSSGGNTKTNRHVTCSCCNILLSGLENALGRKVHLEILMKEGLLDYTMCLPTVLPGECQPRARSLVNKLGRHGQLQPPSLRTLAKAHIAKTFCGLQPVMEMNSFGVFVHKYFKIPAS